MPDPRNPLGGDGPPREEVTGDRLMNQRVTRRIRILRPDGSVQEVPISENESRPDEDGNYNETETTNLVADTSGSVIPSDPRMIRGLSHTDLIINSQEEAAQCTSWLHPRNRSRTIKVGFDGRRTASGVICSYCDGRLGTIYIVIFIFCLAVIWGIWKGAGLF